MSLSEDAVFKAAAILTAARLQANPMDGVGVPAIVSAFGAMLEELRAQHPPTADRDAARQRMRDRLPGQS